MNVQSTYISRFFSFLSLFRCWFVLVSCFSIFFFFIFSSSTLHCFLLFFLFFPRRSVPLIIAYLFLFFFLFTSFNSSIFLCPLRWCRVVMLKTVVYGNQVRFESLKNSDGTCTKLIYVALSSADSCRNIHIYILDTYRRNDNRRKNKGRRKEDAGKLLYNYIHLSLYCKGSKGLFKVCMWEGAGERTYFIFWPHCYDRHVVSFLFF